MDNYPVYDYTDQDIEEMEVRVEWRDEEYPFDDGEPTVPEPEYYDVITDYGWIYPDYGDVDWWA